MCGTTSTSLVQTWTPGAPLGLSAWEAGYADGTQDTVYLVQRYCRLSGAGGAKAFGRGLARRLWLLEPEEYTVLKETPDTLVLANYEDGRLPPDIAVGGGRAGRFVPALLGRRRAERRCGRRGAGAVCGIYGRGARKVNRRQPTKAPGLSCAFRRILIY